ncbi:ABC transporter permease [Streptomyces sp. ZYX-F-203]
MNPMWHAVRVGVRRGVTELRHTFTNGQDVFGFALWTVMLIAPLFFFRDDSLKGTEVSVAAFALPSLLGMTLVFTGVITMAQILAAEREDGTLLRAKSVPNGMVGHLVGKIVMVSGTALASMLPALVAGLLLVDGVAGQGAVGLLTLLWVVPLSLVATLPVGAVIGSLVTNPRTVGLLMLPVMGLVAVSGIYVPLTRLPEWLQAVGQFFPIYWSGLGIRSAMLPADAVVAEVGGSWRRLGTLVALGVWSVAGLLIAPPLLRRMARRESGSAVAERRRKAMQRVG